MLYSVKPRVGEQCAMRKATQFSEKINVSKPLGLACNATTKSHLTTSSLPCSSSRKLQKLGFVIAQLNYLRPNRNNNWCMNAYMASSGFLVLIKHLVHYTEKLQDSFVTSSIRGQRCLDNEMPLRTITTYHSQTPETTSMPSNNWYISSNPV